MNSYKPPTIESEFDSDTSQPAFPKSLYLIYPLFNAYELNPVAPAAQESVLVPEGLDLDAWIVPPPPDPVLEIAKKVKAKGKERESNGKSGKKDGKSSKGKGKQREDLSRVDTPEVETAEERAERARVGFKFSMTIRKVIDNMTSEKRNARSGYETTRTTS